MPRRSPTRLTPEARARLVAEALKGVSTRDLSGRYRLSVTAVNRLRRNAEGEAAAQSMSNMSIVELTQGLPEPNRSALLAKIEVERDMLLRVIERLSHARG